jgi:adenylate cyclase
MPGVKTLRVPLPVTSGSRVALALGVVGPTALGAATIGVLTFWALPTGAALGERHALTLNAVTAAVYVMLAVPLGLLWGRRWTSIPAGADQDSALRDVLLRSPFRLAVIQGTIWNVAAVIFVLINLGAPWLAVTAGISVVLGATATGAMSYWLCERALRCARAAILTVSPPTRPRPPGLRLRAVAAWVLGTGVPLLMVLLVAASSLFVAYSPSRLAVVVLVLGGAAVVSGIAVTAFTAATTADPIDEVRRGMQHVERGDYATEVPVYDASELGLLQAGFNTMVAGLREREQLRDLFGRHVGRDVARLALENTSENGSAVKMGAHREVAVLFVDLVGSSRLAMQLSPSRVAAILNEFFAAVVDVVERHGGWINKFEGDAALAVFGAPVPIEDATSRALAAARELTTELRRTSLDIRAGIGVSAGQAFAGNIGEPRRYEYTVIGDPVNEAARLSDIAKECGGVAASGEALVRSTEPETTHWQIIDSRTLRGRDAPTDIAVPLGDANDDAARRADADKF